MTFVGFPCSMERQVTKQVIALFEAERPREATRPSSGYN
jgi:hypothetical protein